MTKAPLTGVGVLVTRPLAQSSELIEAIETNGGNAFSLPVIEIVPRDEHDIQADASRMAAPDISVFVSSNAVAYGLKYAGTASKAAVGPATAAAITATGQAVDIVPSDGYDSESLLAEAALQDVVGKNIRIIRGSNGRELLADTLRDRGAHVDYLSVYDRMLPEIDSDTLRDIVTAWQEGRIHVVTVMSVESLHKLIDLLPKSLLERPKNMLLVTPATRVIKEALVLYPASRPILASGVQATDMVAALITHYSADA